MQRNVCILAALRGLGHFRFDIFYFSVLRHVAVEWETSMCCAPPPMWPSLAVPLQGQWQTVGPHFVAKVLSHTNVSYFSVKPNEGWGERYKEFSFRRSLWTDSEHLSLNHSSLYCKKTLLCIWTGFYNEVFNILAIKKNLWLHISVSLFVHFLTKTSLSLCTHTWTYEENYFRHTILWLLTDIL